MTEPQTLKIDYDGELDAVDMLDDSLEILKAKIKPIVVKRATFKRAITLIMNKLNAMSLTRDQLAAQMKTILEKVDVIKELDREIVTLYAGGDISSSDIQDSLEVEVDNQVSYHWNVEFLVSDIQQNLAQSEPKVPTNVSFVNDIGLGNTKYRDPQIPKIELVPFSGSQSDVLHYNDFLKQYLDLVGNRIEFSDSTKLIYLKSYLRGAALDLVKHLSNDDVNYQVALGFLKEEFLDRDLVVDRLLETLIETKAPKQDTDSLRSYFNIVRSSIYELKNFGYNALVEDSLGSKILSYIVCRKLPINFKIKFSSVVHTDYPSMLELINNYNTIIKSLDKTMVRQETSAILRNPPVPQPRKMFPHNSRPIVKSEYLPYSYNYQKGPSTLSNFKTQSHQETPDKYTSYSTQAPYKHTSYNTQTPDKYTSYSTQAPDKYTSNNTHTQAPIKQKGHNTHSPHQTKQNIYKTCKFCEVPGHSMLKCTRYGTVPLRVSRLRQLGLCEVCTGRHIGKECQGKQGKLMYPCTCCGSSSHIAALCSAKAEPVSNIQSNMCIMSLNSNSTRNTILPSMTCIITNDTKVEIVRCMIDHGSQSSYISSNLKNKLGIKDSIKQNYNIKTFLGTDTRQYQSTTCKIYITPHKVIRANFLIDEQFNLDYKVTGIKMAIENLKSHGYRLADTFFNDQTNDDIQDFDCLIGSDLIEHLKPMEVISVLGGTSYCVMDGLILLGCVKGYLSDKDASYYNTNTKLKSVISSDYDLMVNSVLNPNRTYFNPMVYAKNDSDIDLKLEHIFSLESIGIKEDEPSVPDKKIVEQFDKAIEFRDNRYYIEIPFKNNVCDVTSNWQIAIATLNRIYKSLEHRNLLTEYGNVFKGQLDKGIIQQIHLNKEELHKHTFIPHHPVVKTDNQVTTKVRVVFNCSLQTDKTIPSLNQACYEGINLLNNMITLLIKFRQNKYIIISDIEKAFLQVYLKKESDKNRFCFLWKDEQNNLIIYRYNTIIFGLNCSPFILNHIIQHHINKYPNNTTTQALKNSFYVDNFVYSTSNITELFQVYNQSIDIMSAGSFNLQSWMTNNKDLKHLMKTQNTLTTHTELEEKVLGYYYNPHQDTLRLADFEITDTENLTKRYILSQVSSVFDPLSLAAPISIKGRVLMKQIWLEGTDWDEKVSANVQKKWGKLKSDLIELKAIDFPRMTVDMGIKISGELNIFCDASKEAYGFCCYYTEIGKQSYLIFSKAKITPHTKTIPQAELLSVYMAIKCIPVLLDSLNAIPQINIWSDAQIALEWLLAGVKPKNIFIKNRLKEITQMKTEIKNKYQSNITHLYVSGQDNVSDLMTRGIKLNEFKHKLQFWLHGPEWLSDRSLWPIHDLKCLSSESKRQIEGHDTENISTFTQVIQTSLNLCNPVLDINRYSSLNKLFSVTYYVLKFIKRTSNDTDLYKQAKLYWIKYMQQESFKAEIDYLKLVNKDKVVIPPLVDQLNLVLDSDDIIRCRGRLSKLNFYCYNVLNPYLLSKSHTLTKLLIEDQHIQCKHLGVGTTLMQLREKGYWIPSGRQVVKDVIKGCMICRKLNCFSFQYPKLTNLPKERVNLIKPFLHTAMDYTSHIFIKDNENNSDKYYILMYTCLGIRSVHLDLLPDLTVNSFLLSFKRFCNSYCIPNYIYTDNAKQFIASRNYLNIAINSDEFKSHLTRNSIKHDTIPVYASWVGGVYERQIKTIKQCLYKTVGQAKLNYYQMITILSDIQNCINSRPLTYIHSDINELIALTPNNILKVHNNPRLQLIEHPDEGDLWHPNSDLTLHEQLNETYKKQLKLFQEFKTQWYGQYLLSLREINQSIYQTNWKDKIKVDDIVLVNTINKPRIYWQMGRVTQLIYSNDGKVRSALLKMPNKQTSCHSIKHLYPLEIQATHTGNSQGFLVHKIPVKQSDDVLNVDEQPKQRVKRRAATRCANLIRSKVKKGLL